MKIEIKNRVFESESLMLIGLGIFLIFFSIFAYSTDFYDDVVEADMKNPKLNDIPSEMTLGFIPFIGLLVMGIGLYIPNKIPSKSKK